MMDTNKILSILALIFGYKKATKFVLVMTILDIITNFILVWNLNKITVVVLFCLVSWMTWKFIQFIKDPTKFQIVQHSSGTKLHRDNVTTMNRKKKSVVSHDFSRFCVFLNVFLQKKN